MRRLKALLEKRSLERQLDSELQFHIDRQTQDYINAGIAPAEARRRALIEFGGAEQIKEECRDARGVLWVEDCLHDLRYGARTLRRSPVFAAVAILSLAVGIGANTAIFSLMDSLMLRMMPVQDPDRLVEFEKITTRGTGAISYPMFEFLRDETGSFEGMFADANAGVRELVFDGEPELATAEIVSASYYSVLGVQASIGRTFNANDARSPVAVISHQYWDRRFQMDPQAVGKTFRLNSTIFTILGVTPPEFFGVIVGRAPDVIFPILMDEHVRGQGSVLNQEGYNFLRVMARLKTGVSIEQSRAEVNALYEGRIRQQSSAIGNLCEKNEFLQQTMRVNSAGNGFGELRVQYSQALSFLMGIVAVVLLIACANLANLLLARASARRKEMSVRLAIGAGRGRLVRQLLAESLLISSLGGALGLVLALWFSNALITMMSTGSTRILMHVSADHRVLAFTAVISILTCVLFGLVPALQATRVSFHASLNERSGPGRNQLSKALIAAQVALSLTLLIGAGLFVRTLINLYTQATGFDRHNVVVFQPNLRKAGYGGKQLRVAERQILERINSLPGIESASVAIVSPISGGGWDGRVEVERYRHAPGEDDQAHFNMVGPRFFETMKTPVLLGREFNEQDGSGGPGVVIVNEAFARQYFGNSSPIGRHVLHKFQIVGVVKNVKYRTLRQEFPRTVYFASLQDEGAEDWPVLFFVRTRRPMPDTERTIGSALHEMNRAIPIPEFKSFAAHVDESIQKERIVAGLASFFALLAIVVACIGIYGVLAFQVAQRTTEIGIRMALGAKGGDVIWMVLRETFVFLTIGIAVGIPAALATTRFAETMLFGIKPNDAATFASSAVLLTLVAIAAGYLPARNLPE